MSEYQVIFKSPQTVDIGFKHVKVLGVIFYATITSKKQFNKIL